MNEQDWQERCLAAEAKLQRVKALLTDSSVAYVTWCDKCGPERWASPMMVERHAICEALK